MKYKSFKAGAVKGEIRDARNLQIWVDYTKPPRYPSRRYFFFFWNSARDIKPLGGLFPIVLTIAAIVFWTTGYRCDYYYCTIFLIKIILKIKRDFRKWQPCLEFRYLRVSFIIDCEWLTVSFHIQWIHCVFSFLFDFFQCQSNGRTSSFSSLDTLSRRWTQRI